MLAQEDAVPLHGYIATALTGLEHDARESIMFLSNKISEVAKQHDLYVYEPRKATDPHEHPSVDSAAVYALDRKRVVDADVLLVLANSPSFGVGQELEIAAGYSKPTILIHHKDRTVSRMVLGSPANFVATIAYSSPEDLVKQLHQALEQILPAIRQRKNATLGPPSAKVLEIGSKIANLRARAGHETAAGFAAEVQLPARLIEGIESGRLENIGVQLLERICGALGVSLAELIGVTTPQRRESRQDANLRKLEELARRLGWPTAEYLDLRNDYRKQLAAKGETEVLSEEQWLVRRTALERQRLQREDDQPRLFNE